MDNDQVRNDEPDQDRNKQQYRIRAFHTFQPLTFADGHPAERGPELQMVFESQDSSHNCRQARDSRNGPGKLQRNESTETVISAFRCIEPVVNS